MTKKLTKEPKKKKKLRDLTEEEYEKWADKYCKNISCEKCIFGNVVCIAENRCWIHHKELYSDMFLDQEIKVVE